MKHVEGEPGSRAQESHVEAAFRDLGFGIKSLQLYPPGSPVIQRAIDRAFDSLRPLVAQGRLFVEVLASSLRVRDQEIGARSPVIEQLARRLHGHGVARVFFDERLDPDSLRRFAELVAGDREAADAAGGLDRLIERHDLPGIRVELLQLERLFEEGTEGDAGQVDLWDALLHGYLGARGAEDVDWEELASDVDKLEDFVGWMLAQAGEHELLAEHSHADILRFVSQRVGEIAAALAGEHVNYLVLTVRDLFDQIDPTSLSELLAEPLGLDEAAIGGPVGREALEPASTEEVPSGAGVGKEPSARAAAARPLDVTGEIARGLAPEQAESLVLHALKTEDRSSQRVYGLFHRLLAGREDRAGMARRIRNALDHEVGSAGAGGGLLQRWPRLMQVLQGEAPARFLSAQYQATLAHLGLRVPEPGVWRLQRIELRMREMRPVEILRRKSLVLLAVLEAEDDDEHYADVARNLEELLPELLVHDDYPTLERLLRAFDAHRADGSDRRDEQRSSATAAWNGFYDSSRLHQLVRDSLGKPQEHVDAVTRIFKLGGPEIVPPLLESLAVEETSHVRRRLVSILASMGEDAIEDLRRRLDDRRWYFVRNLVLILGEVGDERLSEQVGSTLHHGDPRVRREAVLALMKMGDEVAQRSLLGATDERDPEIRLLAIYALGQVGSAAAARKLEQLARLSNRFGQNTPVIQTAAIALGRIGDPGSAAVLEPLTRKAWLFPGRRAPAREAASWAIAELQGRQPGDPPEMDVLQDVARGGLGRGGAAWGRASR